MLLFWNIKIVSTICSKWLWLLASSNFFFSDSRKLGLSLLTLKHNMIVPMANLAARYSDPRGRERFFKAITLRYSILVISTLINWWKYIQCMVHLYKLWTEVPLFIFMKEKSNWLIPFVYERYQFWTDNKHYSKAVY